MSDAGLNWNLAADTTISSADVADAAGVPAIKKEKEAKQDDDVTQKIKSDTKEVGATIRADGLYDRPTGLGLYDRRITFAPATYDDEDEDERNAVVEEDQDTKGDSKQEMKKKECNKHVKQDNNKRPNPEFFTLGTDPAARHWWNETTEWDGKTNITAWFRVKSSYAQLKLFSHDTPFDSEADGYTPESKGPLLGPHDRLTLQLDKHTSSVIDGKGVLALDLNSLTQDECSVDCLIGYTFSAKDILACLVHEHEKEKEVYRYTVLHPVGGSKVSDPSKASEVSGDNKKTTYLYLDDESGWPFGGLEVSLNVDSFAIHLDSSTPLLEPVWSDSHGRDLCISCKGELLV